MPAQKRKPSRHTEVERKFAVTPSTVSPSFGGLSTVATVERSPVQQLDAVYYDTPDQDLARHRITLRRRTGGPDAGWHLKLPAGADARTEVRTPLDDSGAPDDTVPDELRDVVLAIVRDRPIRPVARISTSRRLSRFEEKSAGVWLRVEMRPSAVIAKFAVTNGRVLRPDISFCALVCRHSPARAVPRRLRVQTGGRPLGYRACGRAD